MPPPPPKPGGVQPLVRNASAFSDKYALRHFPYPAALTALHEHCLPMSEMMADVVPGLSHKVPKVRLPKAKRDIMLRMSLKVA